MTELRDGHVARLHRLRGKKRGSKLGAGQADRRTRLWFHDQACTSSDHYLIPEGRVAMSSRRPLVSSVRQDGLHRSRKTACTDRKGDGEPGLRCKRRAPDYQ
jgi:hypothetical protein